MFHMLNNMINIMKLNYGMATGLPKLTVLLVKEYH